MREVLQDLVLVHSAKEGSLHLSEVGNLPVESVPHFSVIFSVQFKSDSCQLPKYLLIKTEAKGQGLLRPKHLSNSSNQGKGTER